MSKRLSTSKGVYLLIAFQISEKIPWRDSPKLTSKKPETYLKPPYSSDTFADIYSV